MSENEKCPRCGASDLVREGGYDKWICECGHSWRIEVDDLRRQLAAANERANVLASQFDVATKRAEAWKAIVNDVERALGMSSVASDTEARSVIERATEIAAERDALKALLPNVPAEFCRAVVDGIWNDLDNRSGFDLGGLDDDIRSEMRESWTKIILDALLPDGKEGGK